MIGFTINKQELHDQMAHTFILKENITGVKRKSLSWVIFIISIVLFVISLFIPANTVLQKAYDSFMHKNYPSSSFENASLLESAQQVSFAMEAPKIVGLGEQFKLTFTLNASGQNLKLPELSDFDVLMGPSTSKSSSIQKINGVILESVSFSYLYVLRAKKEGRFTINAASINVNGTIYKSNNLLIDVVKGSAQKPAIEWANIQAGTFTMGSSTNEVSREANETRHQVTLSAFKMSKHEITVAQFKAFVDDTGYVTDADKGTGGVDGSAIWTGTKFEFKAGVNWKCDVNGNPKPVTEYNHPVIHVSWNDAVAFAEWMGCRLPTEAEWEYGCRAGTTTPFNTGENLTTSQANYDGNYPYNSNAKGEYREKTMPVGSFASNAYGLYDMHGNVWEWCSDWYGDYSNGAQTDPKGPAFGSYRVSRGGSWRDFAQFCRSSIRNDFNPAHRDDFMGFRLVSPK